MTQPSDAVDGKEFVDAHRYKKESEFQTAVKQAFEDVGWLCYHTHDSRRSDAGFPDLVMVKNGRLIFAELKMPKGKVSPAQTLWLTELGFNDHAEVYIWKPSDWDKIQEVLQ